ncbi:chemotaxis protein CheA [Metapseudomonas resinovorans]|uniref:chemotaxis protein CheA n=1 Tax=Metapseudomonas resinovorans TaxID=53412 RepID=UPI00098461B9|nr:chemotaxis protein CheW [Pseudomonas resinovorans]GLZ84705.1 chemotaxis protein CheA [Pseudomonas resinovorans]
MNEGMNQFLQVFFEETEEHLASLELLLLGLDLQQPDAEELNGIFRAAHSIKGSAGMFGFDDLTAVTHELETLLDRIRSGQMALRADMVDLFLQARDVLMRLLDAHRRQCPDASVPVEETVTRLRGLLDAAPAPDEAADFGFFDDAPGMPEAAADDDFGFFDDAPGLPVQDESSAFGLFDEAPGAPAKTVAEAPRPAPTALPPASKPVMAESESSSIRVSVEKIDSLINLVGELVITQAMLGQLGGALDPSLHERIHQALAQLEHNTRDLQESVMSIRMLPISFIFSRFPRLVRDTSSRLGKQVELVLQGEHTELDKGVIERLSDPLTHIVRNSIDHGIELPETRLAAGKPASGTVRLGAFHQGGSIVVQISDDGRGLDRERILAKAREKNLAVHDGMSDTDVWQLIFMPGFSTAEVVTDLSGRGVGMDVVKRNIQTMGGRIDIDSAAGLGTRISIRLPLTLAILDGLIVAVARTHYVIPLTYIVESLQPKAADIRGLGGEEGAVIRVRGEYLPLLSLHDLLGEAAPPLPAEQSIVVILEADGRHFALLVDDLVGQQQVVIKSLEQNFRRIDGIAGATIMGDGSVALILDVDALPGLAQQQGAALHELP